MKARVKSSSENKGTRRAVYNLLVDDGCVYGESIVTTTHHKHPRDASVLAQNTPHVTVLAGTHFLALIRAQATNITSTERYFG